MTIILTHNDRLDNKIGPISSKSFKLGVLPFLRANLVAYFENDKFFLLKNRWSAPDRWVEIKEFMDLFVLDTQVGVQ